MRCVWHCKLVVTLERALSNISQGVLSVSAKGADGNVTTDFFVQTLVLCALQGKDQHSTLHPLRWVGGGGWSQRFTPPPPGAEEGTCSTQSK